MPRILQHVRAQLTALNWPQALESLEVTRLESGELVVEQSSLFEQPSPTTLTLAELAQRFIPRYGAIFRQTRLSRPQPSLGRAPLYAGGAGMTRLFQPAIPRCWRPMLMASPNSFAGKSAFTALLALSSGGR